jgi:hypothetical protein
MILITLTDNKEYAQYDMPKAIGKDYRTVLRHLKLLERYGMIRLVKEEPAKRGGKERKIFGLTFMGLLQALKFEFGHRGITLQRIDEIAETRSDFLPLIFGKWKLFRKYRVRRLIFDRLLSSIYYLPDRLSEMSQETIDLFFREEGSKQTSQPSISNKLPYGFKRLHQRLKHDFPDMIKGKEMDDKDSVNFRVFFERGALEDASMQFKLFSVLKKDKDLEAYVNEQFERAERTLLGQLQNIRSSKQDWISMN